MITRWSGLRMNNIVITPATLDDAKDIYEISTLSFSTPWSLISIEKELTINSSARYAVAKIGTKCIGFGGIWIILDEAHVTNIAVHPEYRGIGIGEKLLIAMIEMCKVESVMEMTLEVRRSNIAAQSLYKKFGFISEGIRNKYYADNKEDAIIMWKHRI